MEWPPTKYKRGILAHYCTDKWIGCQTAGPPSGHRQYKSNKWTQLLHPILLIPCYPHPGLWLTIRIFPEQRPAAGRCPPISHQLTCCAVLLNAPVCSCGVPWFSLQVLLCATPVFPSQKPTMSLLKSVDSHGSRIQISTCTHYHWIHLQSLQSCPMLVIS